MAIEHEHTRVELIHADDEARYLLSDRREIAAILRQLIEAHALLSARLRPGSDSFITAILGVAEDGESLVIDASRDDAINARIAGGGKNQAGGDPKAEGDGRAEDGRTEGDSQAMLLDCVTQLDRVRIQFSLHELQLTSSEGSAAFRAALPQQLLRLQRREFYRLQAPVTQSLTCTLPLRHTDGVVRNADLRVLDISGGGVAIAVPPADAMLEAGMELMDCQLKLPGSAPIPARLSVRNLFRITTRNGIEMLRAGCQFTHMPRGAEDAIQRYILKVERERNARQRAFR